MSTLATADLSSDDDDLDFKLPEPKAGPSRKRNRSSSSSSESSIAALEDENDEIKRLEADQAATEAQQRRLRAAAAFDAIRSEAVDKTAPDRVDTRPIEMIEIQRTRRFAGQTLYETIQLPANDPEVIRYLQQSKSASTGAAPAEVTTLAVEKPPLPQAKPPPRRKPRQSLESMSAALEKGKKMTTLEKSQMDWKKHTSSDKAMQEELEANKRAGGYLQKTDFLSRVGERRMETFDNGRKR